MTSLAFTYFAGGLTNPRGTRHHSTWPLLVERLTRPRVSATKNIAGLSLATFRKDYRLLANVEYVYAVGLDFDMQLDWFALVEAVEGRDAFVHTTWSSTDTGPRARVFMRLSRAVTGEEYRRIYGAIAAGFAKAGFVVDRQASDPSRFWFLPSMPPPPNGRFRFSTCRGRAIDADAALAANPPPAAPEPPPPPSGPVGDVETRAAAYLDRCDVAISGSGGHRTTFLVAQRLVRGFGLDESTAYRLMASWNQRCEPPWKEWELRRKIRQAATQGTMQHGSLRDARRAAR